MKALRSYARFVGHRPRLVLTGVVLVTLLLGIGASLTEQDDGGLESFVDASSETGQAFALLQREFPDLGRPVSIQVIVRGEIFSVQAVNGLAIVTAQLSSDPEVGPTLNAVSPPTTYASLIASLAGKAPGTLLQADVDQALAISPSVNPEAELLQGLIGFDSASEVDVGFGFITQQRGLAAVAELNAAGSRIDELLREADLGPAVEASTVSNAQFEDALQDGLADTQVLFPITLAAIVTLLYLYYRSAGDTIITLVGVLVAIVWFLGAQGLLGPKGLGIVGPSGIIGAVIPVMMIGLTVDYALQVIERRREYSRIERPPKSTERAIVESGAAIALGATTTAVAFATNLAGPLPPIRDFGVLAAAGIIAAFVVMTSLVPALRTVLDQRRQRRGRATPTQAVGGALAPIAKAIAFVAQRSAQRAKLTTSLSLALVVAAATIGLGVSTDFSNADFLPDGHPTTRNVQLLNDQLGGNQSTVSIVIKTDLARDDSQAKIRSLHRLLTSPERPTVLTADPLVDATLPVPVTAISDNGRTALINVPAVIDAPADAIAMIDTIESAVPQGNDFELTVTGDDLLPATISREITRTQVVATSITIGTALGLLTLYFLVTQRRPLLGLVTTAPVVGVLALVLAFMRLAGIVYNPLTALLTSLTIGLGVDYTIHLTHRYLHELESADPIVAIRRASSTTGAALVGSALTTFVGFAVLSLAPVSVISELGTLTAATIVATMLVSTTTLPALLRLTATNSASQARPSRTTPPNEPRETKRT